MPSILFAAANATHQNNVDGLLMVKAKQTPICKLEEQASHQQPEKTTICITTRPYNSQKKWQLCVLGVFAVLREDLLSNTVVSILCFQ